MIELELRLGGRAFPFQGPLDLLVALARREGAPRIPWDRLPVARITAEFLRALAALRAGLAGREDELEDGEEAELLAGFVETASWLALLKSRSLLLSAPGEEENRAPDSAQRELGRALHGRAALQAAAALLGERLGAAGLASGRETGSETGPVPAAEPQSPEPGRHPAAEPAPSPALPTAGDVVAAARRALDALRARPGTDPYPAEAALTLLQARVAALAPGAPASTAPWFEAAPAPEARAALLLALLELARLGQILLHQPRDGGPLYLKRVGDQGSTAAAEELLRGFP